MKKKIFKLLLICVFELTFAFAGCSQAKTTTNNIQKQADEFKVYRKMTFVNLYTGQLLYSAEGYFSVQTTVNNDYSRSTRAALIFKMAPDEYQGWTIFQSRKTFAMLSNKRRIRTPIPIIGTSSGISLYRTIGLKRRHCESENRYGNG